MEVYHGSRSNRGVKRAGLLAGIRFRLGGMTLSQRDVDDLARKVSDLKSVGSEVAVILQVGLGREHELAVAAATVQAAEKLLQQLHRFSVSKSEQPQSRRREWSA